MPRSRIEIYWKKSETAPEGVTAQVRVTDGCGSDYLLPYPCKLTKDGWVNKFRNTRAYARASLKSRGSRTGTLTHSMLMPVQIATRAIAPTPSPNLA